MGFRSDQLVAWFIFILLSPRVSLANEEGDTLYAFKKGLNDPQGALESWDPSVVDPCTYLHITCDSSNKVLRIDLGNAGLSGPLSPGLGDLTNLAYLELFENQFYGNIPPELGNLTNLVSLDLYSNSLKGCIPMELGNLKSLVFLRLHDNQLRGRPPIEALSHIHGIHEITFYPGNKDVCNPLEDLNCTTPCN